MAKKADRPDAGFMLPVSLPETPDYVVAELRYDSRVAFSASKFEGPSEAEAQVEALNKVLEEFRVKKFRSHFGKKASEIRQRVTATSAAVVAPVTADFAQSGFVQIVPEKPDEAPDLARRLNRQGPVWKAVVAPKPVPAAMASGSSRGSRNFEPAQGYLASAPDGIGAMAVWDAVGGRGKGVTICDIEGNWNRSHEDLPRGIRLLGGTLIDDLGWRNHGTAVLGEMVSRPNDFGTVGISHQAKAVVQSAVIGGVFNTAGAILNAASKLKKGDVILIELQATGPNGKYVAMQYWDDVFSAIRVATDKGITVVEAAGNGDENFDLAIFKDTGLQKDSGAVIVGAGVPPTNYFDHFGFGGAFPGYSRIGVPRSRIWFSNYGKIVSVQAWGWHVTTLGYGDAQGGSENRWYTLRFSGTSSASPIVTGAVACIQGRARAKTGSFLPPADVRKLLVKTGTPQEAGPGVPLSQHIGPQPNLEVAFRRI